MDKEKVEVKVAHLVTIASKEAIESSNMDLEEHKEDGNLSELIENKDGEV